MKFLISCIFLIAMATISQANNATWGSKTYKDILLMRQKVERFPVRNQMWNVDMNFPGGTVSYRNISAIYVIDNFRNSSGAIPYLRAGGPKFRFAQLSLSNKVNRGINSTVEIWGH